MEDTQGTQMNRQTHKVGLIWFFKSQSTIFQLCWGWVFLAWVEPVLSKDKCLAQGHNKVTLVRLQPAAPLS